MNRENLTTEEQLMAQRLRGEILKNSQNLVHAPEISDFNELEMISTKEKPVEETYISPIFSMSEDEILAFVEEFEVRELATLSVAELNHIGKVLGVDPKILVEGMD